MIAGDNREWADSAARAEQGAGIADAIAAELAIVAKDGAELVATSGDGGAVDAQTNETTAEAIIGELCTRTQVDAAAEDAIPNIGEVRGFALWQEDGIFGLRGVSDQAIRARQCIRAHIGPVAHNAAASNQARSLNIGSLLNDRAFLDQDMFTHQKRARMDRSANALLLRSVSQQIGFQMGECLPYVFQACEKICMFKRTQIKKIFWAQHRLFLFFSHNWRVLVYSLHLRLIVSK